MYGYFTPSLYDFTMSETDCFRAYYCRNCRCLRHLFGSKGRLLVDYDLTLYSIIIHLADNSITPEHKKCDVFNSKYNSSDSDGLVFAALTMSVLNMKLIDDIKDKDSIKAQLLKWVYHSDFSATKRKYPSIYNTVYCQINKVNEAEKEHLTLLDLLNSYGVAVESIFNSVVVMSEKYRHLCGCLGKFEYYIDIISDYNEDRHNNSYNPIILEKYITLSDYLDNIDNISFLKECFFCLKNEMSGYIEAVKNDSIEWAILKKFIENSAPRAVDIALNQQSSRKMYFYDDCKKILSKQARYES